MQYAAAKNPPAMVAICIPRIRKYNMMRPAPKARQANNRIFSMCLRLMCSSI